MQMQTSEKLVSYRIDSPKPSTRAGFTLVEILVVLGIIAILAALLFPAFRSAQERSRQSNCAANLKQIGVAVQQYFQDEKYYPESLSVLMPQAISMDTDLNPDTDNNPATTENPGGAAYLSSLDVAICPDDDTEAATPRHSYGQYGVLPAAPLPALAGTSPSYTSTPPADPGQYVWNYWGYRPDGYAYQSAPEAAAANPAPSLYLIDKINPYNHQQLGTPPFDVTKPRNVVEHSLSNRYAPKNTVITHCVYHRLPTASKLNNPQELYYNADPTVGQGAKDLILLLNGEVKTLDVASAGDANGQWQTQKF